MIEKHLHDYHEVNISLARPNLMGGVEPVIMAFAVFMGMFGIFVASMNAISYGISMVIAGLIVNVIGRLLAREDPHLCMIYLRSLRYRKFYPPRPSPWRKYTRSVEGLVLKVLFSMAGVCVVILVIAIGYPLVVGF